MDSVLTSAGVAGALTSPSPTRDPSEETFSFMDLLAELRVTVYEHLVSASASSYALLLKSANYPFRLSSERCSSLQIGTRGERAFASKTGPNFARHHFKFCACPNRSNWRRKMSTSLKTSSYYRTTSTSTRRSTTGVGSPDGTSPTSIAPCSVTALKTLKNLGVSFNPRPLPSLTTLTADWAKDGNPDFDAMTPLERRDYAHDDAFSWLQKFWDEILRGL
jgi:hypothetical protein